MLWAAFNPTGAAQDVQHLLKEPQEQENKSCDYLEYIQIPF